MNWFTLVVIFTAVVLAVKVAGTVWAIPYALVAVGVALVLLRRTA